MPKILPLRALPALGALFLTMAVPDGASAQANPQVLIKTSAGEIVVELYPEKAPKTVANFLQYVDDKHYDGTVFHRVIGNFMIQGGGFGRDMKQKPTRAPIPLEARSGLKNDTGWLAMARTSVPDSATSQFFINVVDNDMLNHPQPDGHGYAVFGKVVKGMDTVNTIRAVKTGTSGMHRDVPVEPVVIEAVTRVGAPK
jgi:peptidyl-prolyl cis-trans isomerase A (cyclophilin A)